MTTEMTGIRNPARRKFMIGAAALAASGARPNRARAAKPVRIGVIVPLSGANAQFGINSRNGIQQVADEINDAGGIPGVGHIELLIADSTASPTSAATVAQRMIAQDQVCAILGAYVSSLTIAISEVTERRGIPLLSKSYADQVTSRGFKNVFQVVSKASTIGKEQFDATLALAKRANDPIQRVAIAYEDTAYGTSQAAGLRSAAKSAGIEIVMDQGYPLGITDVSPLINRLRSSNAQAFFPVSYLNDSLLIIRTMRQQKLDVPAIGGAAGYVLPDFQKGLGEFAEGVLSVASANYDLAPDLTERFRKRFGYFMVQEAVEFAAALSVLSQAIGIVRTTDPQSIRHVLATTRFTGGWTRAMPGGAIEFDSTGLNVVAFPSMVQWQGTELVSVYPETVAKARPLWKGKRVT